MEKLIIFLFDEKFRAYQLLDRICSPIISYRANSHTNKASALFRNIFKGKNILTCIFQLLLMAFQIGYSILMTPIAYCLDKAGLKFLMVDLSQIGSLMWIDLYIRERQLKGLKSRKIFVCRSSFANANNFGIDLYNEYFFFVKHPLLKLILLPFFVNIWFREDTFHVQEPFLKGKKIGNQGSYGYEIHKQHVDRFKCPIIKIKDRDRLMAIEMLKPFISPNDKFVVIHARDSGFYSDINRTTRNANIFDYEDGMKFLISAGYKIVRFGDKHMVSTDSLQRRLGGNFFDYAHSEIKCELLDMFLIESCSFCVACASGVLSLPLIFNKPACFVNFYTATTCLGYLDGDLSIFKKFRRKSDNSLVSFQEIMQPPLSENLQHSEIDKLGFYLEDNSSSEIKELFVEFVRDYRKKRSSLQQKAKDLIPKMRHSYNGAGDFGNSFLKIYFPDDK